MFNNYILGEVQVGADLYSTVIEVKKILRESKCDSIFVRLVLYYKKPHISLTFLYSLRHESALGLIVAYIGLALKALVFFTTLCITPSLSLIDTVID